MVAKWPLEIEIAMGTVPMPISVSSGHFALRYEVPKFLARGGHLCMAVLTTYYPDSTIVWTWDDCAAWMRAQAAGPAAWTSETGKRPRKRDRPCRGVVHRRPLPGPERRRHPPGAVAGRGGGPVSWTGTLPAV